MCQHVPEMMYRLSQHALDLFQRRGWPKSAGFRVFARETCGLHAQFEREYPLLQRGQSVPRPVVVAMVEYARRRWGMTDLTPETASLPDPYAYLERGGDGGWASLVSVYNSVRQQFVDSREMYFVNPPVDAAAAARSVMRTVGYLNAPPGESVDEAACVERARPIMNRTPEEYAAWLLSLHRFNFRTTMFTVAHRVVGGRSVFEPVGVSSMLPVTKEAFAAIRSGRLAELEIDESHLRDPSPYLFVHGMAEPDARCQVPLEEVSRGQARCMLYQAAYFTRNIRPLRPHVLTFCGSPKYADRLARHGYRPTGSLLRGTDKPLVELVPPRTAPCVDERWNYLLMKSVLRLLRLANREAWAVEDRASRDD